MADSEAKGKQYMEEAKKKLTNSKGFLGGLFGYVLFVILLTHLPSFISLSPC